MLACEHLSFNYAQQVILTDITLKIDRNTLILGESGSGKTTLLYLLAKILTPDSGKVIATSACALVFQQPCLLSGLTAWENVAIAKVAQGYSWNHARQLAVEMLDKLGLSEQISQKPNTLSAGQAQRVSIARALLTGAEVLLCDEPTGNLDTHTAQQVLAVLLSLDITICMISHNRSFAGKFDQVYELIDGRLVTLAH